MAMPPKKNLIGSDINSKWSMLPPDLIRSVLERLNFVEFHRARCISSYWYSASELCIRQNPNPWLIHFSNDIHVSCKLYDPLNKKTYIVRDLGFDFHKSSCLANSGSWFLMLDHRTDFYLLNIFTRERIHLPTLEEIDGWQMKFERVGESDFLETFTYEGYGSFSYGKGTKVEINKAVLWVDERNKDYLVVWNIDCFFAYHKKGDSKKSWKVFQPLKNQGCTDMVIKESKLYILSPCQNITVFDFAGGDSPKEFASSTVLDDSRPYHLYHLVVTLSGEILGKEDRLGTYSCDVYKMDLESSKWTRIHSLENEVLSLDPGTTAAVKDGCRKNCLYSSNYKSRSFARRKRKSRRKNKASTFSLKFFSDRYSKYVYDNGIDCAVQRSHRLAAPSSSMSFKDSRWFFPTFGGRWLP